MEANQHSSRARKQPAPSQPSPSGQAAQESAQPQAPLPALAQQYLHHVRVEKRLAERTCALYELDLQKLQQFCSTSKIDLLQVQSHHIRQFVARMHSAGRSGRGIALILSGWRGFYTWAGREGHVSVNPVLDVRAPKQAKPLPKALSVDDAVALAQFTSTEQSPALEARDAATVELLYGSGLRVGELVGLDVQASSSAKGWLDLQAGEAHVLGKGDKRRSVPLSSAAVTALQTWLQHRSALLKVGSSEAALFLGPKGQRQSAQSIWQRLRQRSLQAGLATPVHPHMLRHSFASHILQSSQDLRAVQELLGHANISTTQVYTRLDFQHLAKAYDAAHPRAKKK
jgi:integrase/recombinase XerC